ncbi:hypothetical protein WMZ97_15540 [Lentibacillus sp. N15]|uniref:hypothetical protein n=1 Tax=Lentibacillus songyuanensis TaxID=3136161 RepID=UPI0031B9DC3C
MPVNPYYHQCMRCVGRPVQIRTRDGRIHRGVIDRVNNTHVYLRPMGNRNLGGFGYGYGGWGWGGGWGGFGLGFASGIALTAIAAFSPLFFW